MKSEIGSIARMHVDLSEQEQQTKQQIKNLQRRLEQIQADKKALEFQLSQLVASDQLTPTQNSLK